tara:strand:+ start:430 stop:573 length:144 start_codon:yes stop_codon:yes gene_type:complete
VAKKYIKIKIIISIFSRSIASKLADEKNKINKIMEKEYLLISKASFR